MANTTFSRGSKVSKEWLQEVNDHIHSDTPVSGNTVHGSNVVSFVQSGTGAITRTLEAKVREAHKSPLDYGANGNGTTDNVTAFKRAIAAIKTIGAGTLHVPYGAYYFNLSSEDTTLLVDFAKFKMLAEPGTLFLWDYYGLPLIAVIGADDVDIGGMKFRWSGTRGSSPASANHFGYNGTGIISPADWCAHIFVGGSNRVWVHDVSWDGAATTNNLEAGVYFYNGTATGPTSATANVTGNAIERVTSNDVFFGIGAYGQKAFRCSNIVSDRYKERAHVGAGHVAYMQYLSHGSLIENLFDNGTNIDPIGNVSAQSYQFRHMQNCTVRNLKSKRLHGLATIVGDVNGNTFEDFGWEGDRVSDEANLGDHSVITMAQASTTNTMSRNIFRNWHLHDIKNSGSSRSANCPIVGAGGNTYRAPNADANVWENIVICFSPDSSYSKGVCQLFGINSVFDITVINNGSAVKEQFLLQGDDAARPAEDNIVRLRSGGAQAAPRVSTKNGDNNLIILDTISGTANAGTISSGDRLIYTGHLSGSATYDPGSLGDGAGTTTTVTVTGAALGDFAEASFSLDLQGITLTAWVSATNTVSVRFQNETGGTIDLASGTLRVRVRKA